MPDAVPTVNIVALLFMLVLLLSVVVAWTWVAIRFALQGPILPRFEPAIVPWGGRSVLAVLLGWLAIQVGALYAFLLATRGTLERPKGGANPLTPAELMTNSALQNGLVLLLIPLLLWATARARPRDYIRPDRRSAWQVLMGIVAWPLSMPVIYGMMLLAVWIWGRESHPLEKAIQGNAMGSRAIIFFVAGVILAPAAEELIFRGVLLGWLTRLALGRPKPATPGEVATPFDDHPAPTFDEIDDGAHVDAEVADFDPYSPPLAPVDVRPATPVEELLIGTGRGTVAQLALANLAVSILFAGLHYTVWPTPVPIFFLSLVLGFLYQRTGSLAAPIALHMTFNGISTVLMFLTIGGAAKLNAPAPPAPAPMPRPVDPITRPATARLPLPHPGKSDPLNFGDRETLSRHPVDEMARLG